MDRTITIVIPTYKRSYLTIGLASQIRKLTKEAEIIIVDQNNPSPPTKKDLQKLKIKYFNLKKDNTSLAKNKGIQESGGEIIFFFDDDVEITKETIPAHLKNYEDPTVVGVSGRVINDDEVVPKVTKVETGKTNFLGTKFIWQYWSTKKQFVDFPYGCNMSFRKSALKKIEGFDPRFPKIFEEIDLGVRISKNYGKIVFDPTALVYHHKAPSGGTRTDKRNKKNMIYSHYGTYIAKHVPLPFSFITLILRTLSVLKESPWALGKLYRGYINFFLKQE